jgi:protein involved in ribonucleotide reduction
MYFMSKSKNRKDHKKKVAARNVKIKQQKSKMEKIQREFINQLIKMEKEKGLFDNTTKVDDLGPIIDGPVI